MDKEELKDIYARSFPTLKEGEIIKGKIIRRIGSVVLVDMGLKSEGILPVDEFNTPEDIIDGNEIWVYLEALEDKEGFPVISKKKADFQLAWDTIRQKAESAEGIPATIRRRVKGGLAVEVLGLDAFLPGSQVDMRPVNNLDVFIGNIFGTAHEHGLQLCLHRVEHRLYGNHVVLDAEIAGQRPCILQAAWRRELRG